METRTSALQAMLRIDMENLRDLEEFVEETLSERADALEKRVKKQLSLVDEGEEGSVFDLFVDEHWQLDEVFPNLLRSSLLTLCLTRFERELVEICRYVEAQVDLKLRFKHLAGRSVVEKAKRYLKKVGGLPLPLNQPEWERIARYIKLRNITVHKNRRLEEDRQSQAVRKLAEDHRCLDINSAGEVTFKKGFIEEVIQTTEKFLREVQERAKEEYSA